MYIIIVGAGEVGNYLARILSEESHDVAVVEQNARLARNLENHLDVLVVHGNGVSFDALKRAGIRKADIVIAATPVDEVNLVVCMVAQKLGRDLRTIARVRSSGYLQGRDGLTAEEIGESYFVGPERAVAQKVVDLLGYEGAGEIKHLADGRIELIELALGEDSPLCHESLAQLKTDLPKDSLVVGTSGAEGFKIPKGDDQLQKDDRAFILTRPGNVDEFLILSGRPWHHVRHVLIVGCGDIGFHLAQQLESQGLYPTIIEIDPQRAEWVSEKLEDSIVLVGDGADLSLLREQMEETADAVVVLVSDDEKSVLIGLFAKHLGAKKVIVRSDKLDYAPIAHKMGVDALISPRRAIADNILRFVRQGQVLSSFMLGDHEGEIIEMKVPAEPKNSEILERAIKDLAIPEDALLGAVVRSDGIIIPDGETVLEPHDDLFFVVLPKAIGPLETLFAAQASP